MSNKQRRGGGPGVSVECECPLASLGNTQSLDTQPYHHPLSTSPLDPQVYLNLDSGGSGLLTTLAAGSNSSKEHGNGNVVGSQMYPLSRSSSSSLDQTTPSYLPPPRRGEYRPMRPRTYTPIDSLLASAAYNHHRQSRLSPIIVQHPQRATPNSYLHRNGNDRDESDVNRYFLEEKMDALYIQGAIRNSPAAALLRNSDCNNTDSTERYYLENENIDNIYHYYPQHGSSNNNNHILASQSPNILRRASSPSSGSDRYLIDRMRSSPSVNTSYNRLTDIRSSDHMLNSRNVMNSRYPQSKMHHQQPHKSFNVTDGLGSRLGRFSPSLDQGYHTLVSPSPSGGQQQIHATTTMTQMSMYRSGSFDQLPDEVIVKIFDWLDSTELCNLTRVCRRFENLVWDPTLWKFIVLKGEHIKGDLAIKTILRRLCGQTRTGACPSVERVLLSDGCKISDKGMQLLARRCPEITHLQIQHSTQSNQALFDLVTKCTNLQHLDITGCSQITCINVNPGLEPPRRLLLQYLDLTDCASIQDSGLKIIVRNCPLLVYLYLRRCIQITDAGLKFVPSFCIALKELSVSDCSYITDFGLYELAKLGSTLRYLSVAKCDQVSDAGLKQIARRCYKLRYVNTRGCEAVSDDSINVLARSCPRLRALDIGKCDVSDAGLRALAESCPNLKKLSLRNCDMITDRGIQCIAYYCRGLQQLNIQDCQISIEGYRAVKKYCKRCVIEHTNPGFC